MKDDQGIFPPIVALTGTASKSVLKDVKVDLEFKVMIQLLSHPILTERN